MHLLYSLSPLFSFFNISSNPPVTFVVEPAHQIHEGKREGGRGKDGKEIERGEIERGRGIDGKKRIRKWRL